MCDQCHKGQVIPNSQTLMGYAGSYPKLAKNRIIFISEDITKDISATLSALLLYYDNESPHDEITLYIHSGGGDAAGLSNIYDVMQMIKSPIKTVCLGRAYSAAAVLLAAGTKGSRYSFKHAEIMIHGIQCLFPLRGKDQIDSKNYFDFLKGHENGIMKILSHHTGRSLSEIKEDCKNDKYHTAKQALEYGLIDHIIG
jgi:ATP-dependent Clp protease protease subunit